MKSTKAKLKRKLTALCREIVHLRDKVCQKCGKGGERLHTSHIYPKGKYKHLEFDLLNLKLLCCFCHVYWYHKNPIEAFLWLEEYLGMEKMETLALKTRETPLVNEEYLKKQEKELKEALKALKEKM